MYQKLPSYYWPDAPMPITNAERQAKLRERKKTEKQGYREALKQIILAKTAEEMREIAVKVLMLDD